MRIQTTARNILQGHRRRQMRHAPTASDLRRWGSKTRPTTGTLSSKLSWSTSLRSPRRNLAKTTKTSSCDLHRLCLQCRSGAVISMWHRSWTCSARRTCAHKIFVRRWARRVGFFKISRSVCTRTCMYVCTHVLKELGAACTFP
jgi:hypothetical protein